MSEIGLSLFGKSLLSKTDDRLSRLSPKAAMHWGLGTDKSILHILPEQLAEQALLLDPSFMDQTDKQLEAAFPVTRQDRRAKISFWLEYENAVRESRQMELDAAVQGSGYSHWDALASKFSAYPALLAWLLKTPAAYEMEIREAGQLGLERIMEILNLPIMRPVYDKDGIARRDKSGNPLLRPDPAVGMLVLHAFRLVDMRKHGGYTQRSVSVQVDGGAAPEGATLDMAAVDARIKELEQEFTGTRREIPSTPLGDAPAPHKPEPKEVASEVITTEEQLAATQTDAYQDPAS